MEAVEEVAVVPEVAEEILKVAEEEAAAVEDMAITLGGGYGNNRSAPYSVGGGGRGGRGRM